MLMQKLLASAGGVETLYVDDLFQAHTRTGTGASATVTTGINLSAKGGMIWSKGRSGATDHAIYDTSRGATFDLGSNLTSAQTTQAQGLTAFGTTGHTWGTLAKVNTNAATYVDYVFAKAAKFFDVVTWTGNNAANRQIAHSLGIAPGMVIVKRTDSAENWYVYHHSNAGGALTLNTTDNGTVASPLSVYFGSTPTDSVFTTGSGGGLNNAGATYVAYLFAHDTATDGIVQCGSFTTSGTGNPNATVSLGWEPQYIMYKLSSSTGNWKIVDTSRAVTTNTNSRPLNANTSDAEYADGGGVFINATGFTSDTGTSGQTYIYLAIRRSNKPPTTGTQVYNAIARTGTGAAATVTGVGFAPDVVLNKVRNSGGGAIWHDRIRGTNAQLYTPGTNTEYTYTDNITAFGMDGVSIGADSSAGWINTNTLTYINHFFKRAPGVFDEVCYTGTGATLTLSHSLGVVPEFSIIKGRSGATPWEVNTLFTSTVCARGQLNTTGSIGVSYAYGAGGGCAYEAQPTSSTITLSDSGKSPNTNTNNATYVCYLFATLAGISKVFSFTGNGTNQNIECGFTTGARFVLLKRTDFTGNWLVADTVRGLVSGNDPSLALNSTAAEVTTLDWIDPYSGGFNIVQEGTNNANVNAATYIGLAFA